MTRTGCVQAQYTRSGGTRKRPNKRELNAPVTRAARNWESLVDNGLSADMSASLSRARLWSVDLFCYSHCFGIGNRHFSPVYVVSVSSASPPLLRHGGGRCPKVRKICHRNPSAGRYGEALKDPRSPQTIYQFVFCSSPCFFSLFFSHKASDRRLVRFCKKLELRVDLLAGAVAKKTRL